MQQVVPKEVIKRHRAPRTQGYATVTIPIAPYSWWFKPYFVASYPYGKN